MNIQIHVFSFMAAALFIYLWAGVRVITILTINYRAELERIVGSSWIGGSLGLVFWPITLGAAILLRWSNSTTDRSSRGRSSES